MQFNQGDIVLAQDLYYLIHKVEKGDLSEYAIVSPLILIDFNKHQYKAEEDQLQLDVQTIKTKVDSAVHNSEDDTYTIFPKQLRIRKQVNYYESDDEWESSQSSAESESSISNIESKVIEKKQRAPRQKKQDKQIKQKQPSKKRQAESIKNPNYTEQVRENPQLCGNSNQMTDYESQKMNNREIIRAARTGNLELIKNIQSQYYRKINSYYDHWAIENDVTAIDLIFQRQDTEMLRAIVNTSFYYIPQTQTSKLKGIETGYNNQYAYGRRTRKVAAGRGQCIESGLRTGNALKIQSDLQKGSRKKRGYHHQQIKQSWTSIGLTKLMTIETDPTMFDILVVTHNVGWDGLNEVVPFAVRCGNFKTAGHIVKRLFEQGQTYGFNQVHVTVLTETNGQDFDQIKKASSTKQNQGERLITPIHCAAINPNGAYLAHLLDVSQEFNIVDEELNKPIHYAAASQTTATVEVLIERKADLREGNKYKTTPLMIAAKNGRAHNIPLLILDNIHQRDKLGYAAIHYAAVNGSIETIQALLEHGAKVNQPGPNRSTPLSLAASYGHFALVRYLHSKKAKVTSKDKYGRSPLIMAARNGNLEILSYLLIHGSQPNEPDSSGNTPLHYAAAYGFPYCIEELIKAGADQNLMNSWKLTPLSVAIQKNHFGIVKSLLNYPGTDVDCRDDDGRTLLLNTLLDFTYEKQAFVKNINCCLSCKSCTSSKGSQINQSLIEYNLSNECIVLYLTQYAKLITQKVKIVEYKQMIFHQHVNSNQEFSCRIPHYLMVNDKVVYVIIIVSHSYLQVKCHQKRYSEIEKFHDKLDKTIAQLRIGIQLPPFPGKSLFVSHNTSKKGIQKRVLDRLLQQCELQEYFNMVLRHDKLYALPVVKSILPDYREINELQQLVQGEVTQQYTFQIDNYQQLEDVVLYFVTVIDNQGKNKWKFKTRYSDLRDIHQALKDAKFKVPEFPKRKLFGITNDSPTQIEERKKGLQSYLNTIFGAPELQKSEILDYFIQNSKRESKKLQKFDEQKMMIRLKMKSQNLGKLDEDDSTEKRKSKSLKKGLYMIKETSTKEEDDNTTLKSFDRRSTDTNLEQEEEDTAI